MPKTSSEMHIPTSTLNIDSDQRNLDQHIPCLDHFLLQLGALPQFIWKGADPVLKYEDMIKNKVAKNPKLKDVDKIEIV
jgi:hypothetical protein